MNYNLITILGPTAVGKTRLGAVLANRFGGEIISADSRQVYRGMDIGTGKDIDDYIVGGRPVPYHLVDVIDPGEEFNLFAFNKLFYKAVNEILSRAKIPVLVGGTGLYLHSILKGYKLNKVDFDADKYDELNKLDVESLKKKLFALNPAPHNTTDLLIKDRIIKAILIAGKNEFESIPNKIDLNSLVIGVNVDRKIVRERITNRLRKRLESGMVEEVQNLLDKGITFEKLEFFGLEYKFIAKFIKNEITYEEMFEKLNTAIHQFAKRQMTWFRKLEREGIEINWIEGPDFNAAEKIILEKYFS